MDSQWHRRKPPLAALSALAVGVYFVWHVSAGLRGGINMDDLSNLIGCTTASPYELLIALVRLDQPVFRPTGGLLYCAIYHGFGLDPLPYRVLCFTLLAANLILLGALVRAITGSGFTGVLAALFAAFHPRLVDLYWSTGTVYDLLCFFFVFAGLLLYVRWREAGGALGLARWSVLIALFVLALGAKELAVAFPFLLLLYELLYRRPPLWFGPCLAGLLLGPYLLGKLSAESPLAKFDHYRLEIGTSRFANTAAAYLGDLLFRPPVAHLVVWALLFGTLVLAAALRSRHLLFAWCMTVLFYLPMAFIPPRGLYMTYLALGGAAFYGAILLSTFSRPWMRALVFAASLLLLMRGYRIQRGRMGGANALSQPLIGSALLELKRTGFAPGRGAQVRVIDDPFLRTEQPHGMTLLLRLYTRDATLAVERGETGHGGNGLILDWRVGELRIRQP